MRTAKWIPLAAVFACGAPAPVAAPAPAQPPSPSAPRPLLPATAGDAGAARDDATAATVRPAPPALVTRSGKEWPFHGWTRAEALTFNRFDMRPGAQLRVYDDRGWSDHVGERKALAMPDAQRALDWVKQTEGDVSVSKCPFPRHAVVLFEGDVPVASINVCFECGDIMVWPSWQPEPDWDRLTAKQRKDLAARNQRQMKRYEQVFPRWKQFFRDDLGFAIEQR